MVYIPKNCPVFYSRHILLHENKKLQLVKDTLTLKMHIGEFNKTANLHIDSTLPLRNISFAIDWLLLCVGVSILSNPSQHALLVCIWEREAAATLRGYFVYGCYRLNRVTFLFIW